MHKDITGRIIHIGDFIVIGKRSGNSGTLDLGVVHDITVKKVCVTYESWNGELTKGGTTFPERTAVIDKINGGDVPIKLIELSVELVTEALIDG